ncbi:hypothetical protein GCK32_013900 [Trichostrongylus colubriformis]|uniref:Uncharacterized protein n=1 Tax=Trichostrongylus colubriformis TaxID=6319 RepID=A0AAN8IVM6_TRICO
MSSLLTTKKRLLTLYVNKLEHILNNLKGEKLEDTPLNPDLPQDVQSENIYGLEEGISVLESSMEKVEQALHELASIGDNPELTCKEKEIEDYTANCEATLLAGFDYLLVLQARLKALSQHSWIWSSYNIFREDMSKHVAAITLLLSVISTDGGIKDILKAKANKSKSWLADENKFRYDVECKWLRSEERARRESEGRCPPLPTTTYLFEYFF